jgi:plasmid replication initiation protein
MERDSRCARHARGLELILPDWFYSGVLNKALVLTIDRAYFDLTGGLERWLYRLVRKHGGRQEGGWSFDLVHFHAKSGSLSPLKHFAYDLRHIVHHQSCPAIDWSSRMIRAVQSD